MSELKDWIVAKWHYVDVKIRAKDNGIELTDDQSREILKRIARGHDAEIGINWDVIDAATDAFVDETHKDQGAS